MKVYSIKKQFFMKIQKNEIYSSCSSSLYCEYDVTPTTKQPSSLHKLRLIGKTHYFVFVDTWLRVCFTVFVINWMNRIYSLISSFSLSHVVVIRSVSKSLSRFIFFISQTNKHNIYNHSKKKKRSSKFYLVFIRSSSSWK